MEKIRIGVVGTGGMASQHLENIAKSTRLELGGICDVDRDRADQVGEKYKVPAYYDYQELFAKESLQAVLIATPHYFHTPITIDAFRRGMHVLVEKPIAVHAKDATKMIQAYEEARAKQPKLVFSAMFMQRTQGRWRAIKELITSGRLGKLVRATWIVTDWFRTQEYYNSGGWRATWKGEGGGVLLNQCPHNLDLYQWFFGMPKQVLGIASLGKYHRIEVEDEVTAIFEHDDGMVGHFITSTGESPGTNRLEIVGEHGKLVFENDELLFDKNEVSMLEFIRTSKERFTTVPHALEPVSFEPMKEQGHRIVLENFAEAIQEGTELIAPAVEGHASVTLANSVVLSAMTGERVSVPIDEERYEALLNGLIEESTAKT